MAPSIPAEFFELAAKAISDGAGIEVDLQFEQRISGPLPGDVNPLGTGAVDIGFVCSPTFRWLADELDLLPVPVPSDTRAHGRPVYFADVIVRAESPYLAMEDLRGRRWAYNDRNSRSGWFSMIDRIAPLALGKWTQRNFTETIRTGRHMGRGRQILPPMPIPMYKHFTDADLEAIFSFLQTIPPVKNRVPEPLPATLPVAAK